MVLPEILAPAGSMEALKAAIGSGADAVYLGGKLFNARQHAANFDEDEIAKGIKLAHSQGVKVYITVNVLLHNNELEEAAHYLKFLNNAGADGIIVQDLGLLLLAQELTPDLPCHASTQMTIHNSFGAEYFAQKGLKRLVLARELSLKDIQTIKEQTSVELEVFVHGALCISYSGQCLMSSMIGGRSGNRGRCAQPCRLPYQLETEDKSLESPGKYLLSPKDLCTIDILPDLLAAGVNSLKFEGRMKRPEYVATVIRIYRQALERCAKDPEHYVAEFEEKRQLAQIFNRDFTPGYYLGNPGADLMSYQRPNNRGVYLGRIGEIQGKKGLATIKLEQPLGLGDGLEFWVSRGGRQGSVIKEILLKEKNVTHAPLDSTVQIKAPPQVRTGDRIFKTHDAALITKAQASYNREFSIPQAKVEMMVSGKIGEPLRLIVRDDKGNKAWGETDFIIEKAKKTPLTTKILEEQLGRLGNTDFVLANLKTQLPPDIMVPFSELNALRRKVIGQLEKLRLDAKNKSLNEENFQKTLGRFKKPMVPRTPKEPKLAITIGDPASFQAAMEELPNYIYINGEIFSSKRWVLGDFNQLISHAKEKNIGVYYRLPRLWLDTNNYLMIRLADRLAMMDLEGLIVSNPGAITWAEKYLPQFPLFVDYPFNIFNDLSIEFLAREKILGITISPELTFEEISKLKIPPKLEMEGLIHGALPLMISEHCTVGAVSGGAGIRSTCGKPCFSNKYELRDRKGYFFPVEMDQFCRMHIFNSQDLCLIDALPRFLGLGYDRLRIEASRETPAYVRSILTQYRKALNQLEMSQDYDGEKLRKNMDSFSPQGLTKGHYFRGV